MKVKHPLLNIYRKNILLMEMNNEILKKLTMESNNMSLKKDCL